MHIGLTDFEGGWGTVRSRCGTYIAVNKLSVQQLAMFVYMRLLTDSCSAQAVFTCCC